MKKMKLVLLQLLFYYRENKAAFLTFLLSSIVCTISFLYCYGNMIGYIGQRSSQERYWRQYQIRVDKETVSDTGELISKTEHMNFDFVEEIALCSMLNSNEDTVLYASVNNGGRWNAQEGRVDFDKDELANGSDVMIVPGVSNQRDEIIINAVRYKIIGVHSSNVEYRIPLNNYLQNNYKTDFIIILTKRTPTRDINEYLMKEIRKEFPDNSVYSSYRYVHADMKKMPFEVLLLSLLYGVSLLSFLFLYAYMVRKSYRDFLVFNIVGASRLTVAGLVLLEMLVLSAISVLAGIFIHFSLYDLLFAKLNYVSPLYYTWTDYGIVFCVNVFVTTVINIPFVVSFYRTTIWNKRVQY